MNKILYVTTVSRTINAFLIPHIEMLQEKDYIVDCACAIDKPIDKELLAKGVSVYDVPFSRNPFSIKNIKAFSKLKLLQKINEYDVIHVHTPVASIYGRLLKLRFPKLKTIYTAHGYHFYKGAPKKNWHTFYFIEKLMVKLTDVTININAEDYKLTKEKLNPKNCYLINGVGIDLNKYKPLGEEERLSARNEIGLRKDDFVILMIGELNENKNQIQLLRAIEILKDKYPKIKALLVGEGSMEGYLKKKIKEYNLEDEVKLLGFREDITNLINLCDIGALFSEREGLPRSIMEFMALGKKVIGTDVRGIRDLIENKEEGTLVKLGDYEETAKVIEKYYLNGNDDIIVPKEIEKYNVSTIVKELEEVYKALDTSEYIYPIESGS